VIGAAWIALSVLAVDAPLTGPSATPCAPTSFAGTEAFLVVDKPLARERAAIATAQRARARKLEATVIRGQLFEKMGASYWVVYGAFASEKDGAAAVAALAKLKIAASVVASGAPLARAPDRRAPIVRICGEARSHAPITVDLRDAHYVTETDVSGYFELWLKGWGQAQVQTAALEDDVDLPKVAGASARTRLLRE